MKKLAADDVLACRNLGAKLAEEQVDNHILFHNQKGKLNSCQLVELIFEQWSCFADSATSVLVEHKFIDTPSVYSGYGHEKLLAFRVLAAEYERRMAELIVERHRTYLNVPFSQKDEVKCLGALWDVTRKKWYVPDGVSERLFEKWLEQVQPKAQVIPGTRASLYVDLVPSSAWFSNLRSELTQEEWGAVKKKTFRSASYRCQACGGVGPKHPVECHERWRFDHDSGIQTLVGTIAFCPACHEATHFGLARVRGRDRIAIQQLMCVNRWSEAQVMEHVNKAMEEWKGRSRIRWKLDARWLLNFVVVSDATQKKILGHAEGICNRKIQGWQNEVVLAGGLRRLEG